MTHKVFLNFDSLNKAINEQALPMNMLSLLHNCFIYQGSIRRRKNLHELFIASPLEGPNRKDWMADFKDFAGNTDGNIRIVIRACTDIRLLTGGYYQHIFPNNTNKILLRSNNSTYYFPQSLELYRTLFIVDGTIAGFRVYTPPSSVTTTNPYGVPVMAHVALDKALDTGFIGTTTPGTWARATGSYLYAYSYYNDDCPIPVEGPISSVITQAVTVVTNSIVLTIPTMSTSSAFTQYTNKLRIYRQDPTGGGSDQLYQLAEITWSSTSSKTYTDTGLEVDLAKPAPTNKFRFDGAVSAICLYANRVWRFPKDAADTVYYSPPLEVTYEGADYAPSSNILSGLGNPDDQVVAAFNAEFFIVVIKKNSIWAIEGRDPASFSVKKLLDEGSVSPRSTIEYNGDYFFINEGGLKRWTIGSEPIVLSAPLGPFFSNLEYTQLVIDTEYQHLIFSRTPNANKYNQFIYKFDLKTNKCIGELNFNHSAIASLRSLDLFQQTVNIDGDAGYVMSYSDRTFDYVTHNTTDTKMGFRTGHIIPTDTLGNKKLFRTLKIYHSPIYGQNTYIDAFLRYPDTNFTTISQVKYISSFNLSSFNFPRYSVQVSALQAGLAVNSRDNNSTTPPVIHGFELEYEEVGVDSATRAR